MLKEDPILIVRDLLVNNWKASNTPLADAPRFTTGWYEFGSSDPQITLTNTDEGVLNGGVTGHSGMSGDGSVVQYRTGSIRVNCWAGTYEDLEGAGTNGGDVSPKDASYQMANEVHRIIQNNANGTTDSNGNKQLHALGLTETRRMIEDEEEPTVFRYECTVDYSYLTGS